MSIGMHVTQTVPLQQLEMLRHTGMLSELAIVHSLLAFIFQQRYDVVVCEPL